MVWADSGLGLKFKEVASRDQAICASASRPATVPGPASAGHHFIGTDNPARPQKKTRP